MTDQATTPVSPVQSTTALQQNASYPGLETSSEVETPKNGHSNGKPIFRFSPLNARLMAQKSAETRRRLREERKRPQPITPEARPPIQQPHAEILANTRLDLIREQIELTRATLNDTRTYYCPACERAGMEPHHRAALLRALDSLLDRERILLGIPGPGTLKPMSQSRRRAAPSDLAPLPISPADGQ